MERPGFCGLLSFGAVLCILGVVVGALIAMLGLSQFETHRETSFTLVIAGAVSIAQSLVLLGVLQALNWIVLTLQEMKPAELAVDEPIAEPIDDYEPDGIRNKPILKRRKV